jgi:hypothetical protein
MAALVIQLFSYALWFPLKILGISALLRVGVRRYPLIFSYMVVTFLLAVVEAPISIYYHLQHVNPEWYATVNSIDEGITYTLILAVVISLIYRTTARVQPRRIIRLALMAGGFLFIAISFLVHYDSHLQVGGWVTPLTRDLNVCAAILDLALWGLLISSRQRDSIVLLLTGGMGIMFAGEAIGKAIESIAYRYKSRNLFYTGHIVMMLADAAFLYIWWRTFQKEAKKVSEAEAARHATSAEV